MSKRSDHGVTVMIKSDDRTTPPPTVKVRLPVARGALRCGLYAAGVVYSLPQDEAERLVRVKGFEVVGDEPGDTQQINREE